MMTLRTFLRRLRADQAGAVLIETAFVAPVLVLMALGAFQISGIVARQSELQSAAAEAAAIALASAPDTAAKRTTLQQVVMASTGLSSSHVAVIEAFRCGANTTYNTNANSCGSSDYSRYVKIVLTDTYTPTWTQFGIGSNLNFSVTRYVMLSQVSD